MVRDLSLAQVAAWLPEARVLGDGTVRLRAVHHDSRRVEPGTLFLVRRGQHHDGRRFVQDAIDHGAVALLTSEASWAAETGLPAVVVDDVLQAASHVAAAVYGAVGTPGFDVIGVTGTNGKTTVTFLVDALLRASGARPARLGTLGGQFGDLTLPGQLTTPEADDLARTAAQLRSLGATHLALEVSSHALALGRVEAVRFRTAAFTNLSRDHLDFHGTMEAYGNTKARLFTDLAPASAVINVDDPFGAQLATRVRGPRVLVSPSGAAAADVSIVAWASTLTGSTGVVRFAGHEAPFASPLLGDHNRENVAVALGVLASLERLNDRALHALSDAPQVPGRLERCSTAADNIAVVVDYAHTPDALARTLSTLRALTSGRLWCVFGCGGDRDAGKRAPMGKVAGTLADEVILTDDNPRSEDSGVIIRAVAEGLHETGRGYQRVRDRAEAIAAAIRSAAPWDTVLIAGKGHETYQIVGAATHAFDDRQHARQGLARRRLLASS